MALEWRPAMSVDGAAVDDDHRYLIRLINEYEALTVSGDAQGAIVKALHSLKYYTVYHFVREEALQREINFPSAAEHAAEHKRLAGCVDDAIHMLERAVSPEQVMELRDEVARLLKTWLVNHIVRQDLTMRPFVRKNGKSRQMALTPLSRL